MSMTNTELQAIVNRSEDYAAIDRDGNLQSAVNDDTAYIIDIGADTQGKYHNSSDDSAEAMVIYDREGKNYYSIKIKKWY